MGKKSRHLVKEPPENAPKMFAMAKSDLSVARFGKMSNDTLYETLCTLCQQAIEKSLKSLMIYRMVPFPREHSIQYLVREMEKQQIILPDDIKTSALAHVTDGGGVTFPIEFHPTYGMDFGAAPISLSEYAKDRRYSLSNQPLEEQDYKNVLTRCEMIVAWVEQQIYQTNV
jgi:hypothetical protein